MPLTTTTKAADMKKLMDDFFKDNNVTLDIVSVVSGKSLKVVSGKSFSERSFKPKIFMGRKSGFAAQINLRTDQFTHCILHRHEKAIKVAYASKSDKSIKNYSGVCEH